MDSLTEALLSGAPGEVLAREELPDHYEAAHLRAEDVGMFDGVRDKDVRASIRVGPVAMPDLAPDEVLVAVMASAINYNTVWSATFEPVPTFRFLERFGRQGGYAARHDLPHQVIGSDGSGVVVRSGAVVRRWRPGDHVVMSCVQVDEHEPATHADAMLGAEQRIWGYETNFGGLARYTVVKASQLLPKPAHLTWEESAGVLLTAATSYRMLISDKGARIKLGDVVLIWGATGGLGGFAVQLVKQAGGIPVGVVSSEHKAKALRALGCEVIINRAEIGLGEAASPQDTIEQGKRLGRAIRKEVGEDPSVAFDYIGRATFGVSVFVVRRGGTVVTCGSSTGYQHDYDNRYLWMNSKRIIGSHAANLQEQSELNRLVALGKIHPVLSSVYSLDEVGEAARLVQTNQHLGKVAVLCQAPREGLGVTDPELRERIGPDVLNPLRSL
ncbi:crotonyl-CoA carboxylase/reductase [Streptomyces sp. ISL-112]|uniref:crotonyl-CoA carboxylase/reductase n=1 Tax=unclassified Streptomyces TaxID=2593676 RepID=UPI001BEAC753|nr:MULTISPECIES: crotonyl-CoA carboxylase/reductase [unclassified Streptomyces]MBT2426313.1 crotonyl-CoA carboxylase/reductase [Streptomyces sp. ISL-112]MBT2465833.1 crotonyl-CoA carboxylase/reductase [Streptomyces sp. ISL-63]